MRQTFSELEQAFDGFHNPVGDARFQEGDDAFLVLHDAISEFAEGE